MTNKIEFKINEFKNLNKYPKDLFYRGNLDLLKNKKFQ